MWEHRSLRLINIMVRVHSSIFCWMHAYVWCHGTSHFGWDTLLSTITGIKDYACRVILTKLKIHSPFQSLWKIRWWSIIYLLLTLKLSMQKIKFLYTKSVLLKSCLPIQQMTTVQCQNWNYISSIFKYCNLRIQITFTFLHDWFRRKWLQILPTH
jgi:hypothetical protein